MIRVSAYYANGPDKKFDMDYYHTKHLPMVADRLKPQLVNWEIDKGLAGGTPGAAPPFLGIGHLYFNSVDDFQAAFGPHAAEILADTPNFTNIEPEFQISEVLT